MQDGEFFFKVDVLTLVSCLNHTPIHECYVVWCDVMWLRNIYQKDM